MWLFGGLGLGGGDDIGRKEFMRESLYREWVSRSRKWALFGWVYMAVELGRDWHSPFETIYYIDAVRSWVCCSTGSRPVSVKASFMSTGTSWSCLPCSPESEAHVILHVTGLCLQEPFRWPGNRKTKRNVDLILATTALTSQCLFLECGHCEYTFYIFEHNIPSLSVVIAKRIYSYSLLNEETDSPAQIGFSVS